jgi:Helix-turn-helix domain
MALIRQSGPVQVPVLLTTTETAAILSCSPKTLEADRVRRRWRVPFLRVGRSIKYDRAAVLKWLSDRNPTENVGG